MTSVAVEITRYVNDAFPGWVEAVLIDARGSAWTFVEKVPVVSSDSLTASSSFPCAGAIACEVVPGSNDAVGSGLVESDTSSPWGVTAKGGNSRFVVRSSQLGSK